MEDIIIPHSGNICSYFDSPEYAKVLKIRLQRIQKSQNLYGNLFQRLNVIVDKLKQKYVNSLDEGVVMNETEQILGMSQEAELENIPHRKRKWSNESDDYIETDTDDPVFPDCMNRLQNDYPKYCDIDAPVVIIGPNGTRVGAKAFDAISWTSAAGATRCLLGLIFSNDVLATHTLTGKPSPAFYGRERPLKMQLDPMKTADIIYCVRSKFGGHEREVRAAITTKCADAAKKYKRHLAKKIKLRY